MVASRDRISPQAAKKDMQAGALLVCAYGSNEEFAENHIAGAMSMEEFINQKESIPLDREIIFYCGCPHDASAIGQAAQSRAEGFRNARALAGGIRAWREAGYEVEVPVGAG